MIRGGLGLERHYRELWEPAMRARLYARSTAASLAIVEAELGADAGVVGAALAGAG